MAVEANTLLDEAKCYICYGASQSDALQLAMLNRILESGGGGGGNGEFLLVVNASPNFTLIADANEQTAYTLTIPANTLGENGGIRVTSLWETTNNANAKTVRYYYGAFNFTTVNNANSVSAETMSRFQNFGATNAQRAFGPTSSASYPGTSTSAILTAAIDSTIDQNLIITGQKASAGDAMTLLGVLVEVFLNNQSIP